MPTLVLAFNYWLHLIATVVWLGGLAMLTLTAWPGRSGPLGEDGQHAARVFDTLERRVRPLANISLVILLVTGMLQMGENPSYEGLLRVQNPWSVALLVKHVVVAGMIAVGLALQWGIYPALARAGLQARRDAAAGRAIESTLRRRLQRLTAANLALGLLVLLLTAFMTAL
jgi:uncharacterized membrane protein